jgi:predicted ATPase/DNA-binding SARP family transcriptional activator
MWTIHLLGGLNLHSDLRQVTRFRTQKAASLLAYLALHLTPQPRETLIALLWPDAEPEAGRHNLSNALCYLRHLLEPPGVPPGTVLLADRASVRLNPAAITVDVLEFESDLARAQAGGLSEAERLALLLRALERYQGVLLPGYYEEWVAPEALRLESLFVQGALRLAPLLLGAGRREQAVAYAQRAVSADPLSEEATRWLMQAFAASGQPAQALRAYRQLERRLEEDLDARPSPALQHLAEQVGSSRVAGSVQTAAESVPPAEPGVAVVSAAGAPRSEAEAREGSDRAGAAPRGRLRGAEFLLRTTVRFFGREEEIARLGEMLSTSRTRLVTLTGPGGIGKTSLALEVAAHLVETTTDTPRSDAPTAAVFVSLAPVSEADRLFEVLLRALGSVPTANQDPLDQLVSVLEAHSHPLLVLDNFEQLGEEGALRIHDLLGKSAEVKLMITSRQKLHLEGEREFRLAPLPTSGGAQSLEALLEVASIALFVDRAQAALPDFQLTERNASAVAQLCDYLEGLPLAIELAAARVGVLSPARILEQVQVDRLDFLATRRRDAPARQRTLRATLDWSYRLLSEQERAFLAGLSVFRGGWTLEGAEAVFMLNQAETLEALMLLRDNSLIKVADTEDGIRFTLLETVREYAAEQLERIGDREVVMRRHRDFFLKLTEEAEPHLIGPEQSKWLERLESEHENLRAALARSLEEGKREKEVDLSSDALPASLSALRFCGALQWFWSTHGHWIEALTWYKTVLEADGARKRTAERAKALNGAGMLACMQGDFAFAQTCFEERLVIEQEFGDRSGIAFALNGLGNVARYQGEYAAARGYLEESLAIWREIGNQHGIATALNNLGNVVQYQGDYAAARDYYEESLAIKRESGDRRSIADSLNNLGLVAFDQGDYIVSRAYHEESLAIRREIGDRRGIASSLNGLGNMALFQSDYAAARDYYEESLAIWREIGSQLGIATALNNLGYMVVYQGDYAAARGYLEECLALWREIGDQLGIVSSLEAFAVLIAAETAGFAVPVETTGVSEKIGVGMRKAARLWGAVQELREEIGFRQLPWEQKELERRIGLVRERLGETDWKEASAEGQAMTLEQAVECALQPATARTA